MRVRRSPCPGDPAAAQIGLLSSGPGSRGCLSDQPLVGLMVLCVRGAVLALLGALVIRGLS